MSNPFIESICKRPYVTIVLVWLLVYIPLALLLDSQFPEDTRTYLIDQGDETNRIGNTTIFMHDERGLVIIMNLSYGSERIEVQVENGYIPLNLEIVGKGKLYSSDEYDTRRTWKLGWDKVQFVQGSQNLTISVDVTRAGIRTVLLRDIGNTLLEGKTLFKDVPTHEPPLSNVFWAIPCTLGGTSLAFRLFVGFFILLSALFLMKGWKEEGKFRMVAIGTMVLLNPLSLYSAIGIVQNSAILLFLVSSALTLYKVRRRLWASMAVGIGMSTGLFPALLIPGLLAERDELYRRVFRTLIALVIGIVPIIVIRNFEPEGVDHFLGYYLTGGGGHSLQGISLWRFLSQVGLPSFLILPGLLVFTLFMLNTTVRRKRLGMFFTGLLLTLLFLTLYPNIPAGAFLMPLAFVPFFWELSFLRNTILVLGSVSIILDLFTRSGLDEGYLIMVPFMLSLGIFCVLIYLMVKVLGSHMRYENRLGYTKY
jgi:hypothetical protein